MGGLHVVVRARIHPGKLEEFKQVANTGVAIVREKDTGTRRYDWFLSEDGAECIVLEHYADANALLAHLANLGPALGYFFELTDSEISVLGDVTPELRAAISSIPHRVYTPLVQLHSESA